MKIIRLFMTPAIIVAAFSCGEIEVSKFETEVGTATIEGLVERDDDLTDGETNLVGAASAEVFVSYFSSNLSYSGSSGINVTKTIAATTDSNGRFSVEVPAIAANVTYTVRVPKYFASYLDFNDDAEEETFEGFHPETSQAVTLVDGETEYVKFTLGSPTRF